jgi:flagellar hook-length control protein FliK
LAGAGTGAATPAAEEEAQSTDVAATPDPAAILAGAATQQTAQVTLPIPAIPVAITPVVDASAEGATAVGGEMPEAGAVIPAIGTAGAGAQTAAGAATTSTPATAQAAAIAQPTAATALAQPATPIDTADAESADSSAATTSSANGQAPAKAAATGTQTPAAQGAPANTAANSTAAAGAQVEVAVEAASTLQSKAGAATEFVASTTTTTQHTSNTASASQVAQTAAPAATLQVYTRFVERFDGRAQRFEVRLDPAELGRVDVRIEIGADKKVHAVLAAHDSAALNDLMRGHRALERMLTNAGIDLADGGVKFEMASDSGRNATPGQSDSGSSSPNVWRRFDTLDIPLEASTSASPQPWRRTRLDLVA